MKCHRLFYVMHTINMYQYEIAYFLWSYIMSIMCLILDFADMSIYVFVLLYIKMCCYTFQILSHAFYKLRVIAYDFHFFWNQPFFLVDCMFFYILYIVIKMNFIFYVSHSESCCSQKSWVRHVTHTNESCHTHEWLMSYTQTSI